DEAEQLQRPVQGGLLPGQPVVGGQGVDGKSLVVGVLGGVQRAAQSVAAPVDAAVFPVKAVVLEPLVGVAGAAGGVRPAGEHGRLGKEPEDAAVEDAALFGLPVHLEVICRKKSYAEKLKRSRPSKPPRIIFQHNK